MRKIIYIIFLILSFANISFSSDKFSIKEGNSDAKIKLIIFESMTCSHCGDFHREVYPDLKKKIYRYRYYKYRVQEFSIRSCCFKRFKNSSLQNWRRN